MKNINRPRITLSSICSWLLVCIFTLSSLSSTASALGGVWDSDFYSANNILFYSPGKAGDPCAYTPSAATSMDIPSLTGKENAEKIWNYLTGQGGLSPEQAAGVMGNLAQESGYNPNSIEGNSVGFGIIQWSFGRRDALETAAKSAGIAASDLGFQLKYMTQEAESTQLIDFHNLFSAFGVSSSDNVWDALKKQTTIEKATTFWHDSFERSNDYNTHGNIQHRIDFANDAYKKFKGSLPAGSSNLTDGAIQAACNFAGGDLTQTLLAYAWPTYSPNNYETPTPGPKPAYLEVATKLTKEGKWVGGGMREIGIPGIDCGGFVSVLLTQSGFEPDYNFGLDESRGASNQEYGQLPWAKRHWKFLGNGGRINPSDLRPGDVAYSNGHTFVYVGQVNGFGSQYASASYSWWRAPMAGGTFETATSPDYVWYGRRSGAPAAYGSTKMSDPIPPGNDVNPGESIWTGGDS